MRKLIYGMGVSLDGYIADGAGAIDWSAPDEELHRFHNEQGRETGVNLYGRRMWETMRVWGDDGFATGEVEREWAEIWKATPKLVFSTTLDAVEGNTTLHRDGAREEVERLKREPGKDLAVGGAGLAASLVDLIDEYRLYVSPVLLGAGTPFFPPLSDRIGLELAETRTFGSRVVYLRYLSAGARAPSATTAR
jgi:dihydrofolate reductase